MSGLQDTMGDPSVRTRNYQLEMFERSMKENIIVAVGFRHKSVI